MTKAEVNQYSPLTLAFLGDAVYEQLVRERIVLTANAPVNVLHDEAVKKVRASYQAAAVEKIEPLLTADETSVLKRGRNATGNIVPKSSNPTEYRRATSLETLFGWLHLLGDNQRIDELFGVVWGG